MSEPIPFLRKAFSTVLAAIVLATGVATPILDRDGLASTAHIDATHEGSCAQHPHNHAICVVLGSAPQLVADLRLPAFADAEPVVATHRPATPWHIRLGHRQPRSRAPPV